MALRNTFDTLTVFGINHCYIVNIKQFEGIQHKATKAIPELNAKEFRLTLNWSTEDVTSKLGYKILRNIDGINVQCASKYFTLI